jgi:large subunit ribosomal protein L21
MYAIVNYKGNQILVREGENTRIPFLKDSKIGSTLNFDNVLFFDDGKKKHYGNPILKNINFIAKIVSHERDSKVIVFKKKRRKGYQKKNGYRDQFTVIKVDKLSTSKKTETKKTAAKKPATKKTAAKKPATKKTTASKKK